MQQLNKCSSDWKQLPVQGVQQLDYFIARKNVGEGWICGDLDFRGFGFGKFALNMVVFFIQFRFFNSFL